MIVHLANASYRCGSKQFLYDPLKAMVVNDEEANRLQAVAWGAPYEAPPTLPPAPAGRSGPTTGWIDGARARAAAEEQKLLEGLPQNG